MIKNPRGHSYYDSLFLKRLFLTAERRTTWLSVIVGGISWKLVCKGSLLWLLFCIYVEMSIAVIQESPFSPHNITYVYKSDRKHALTISTLTSKTPFRPLKVIHEKAVIEKIRTQNWNLYSKIMAETLKLKMI